MGRCSELRYRFSSSWFRSCTARRAWRRCPCTPRTALASPASPGLSRRSLARFSAFIANTLIFLRGKKTCTRPYMSAYSASGAKNATSFGTRSAPESTPRNRGTLDVISRDAYRFLGGAFRGGMWHPPRKKINAVGRGRGRRSRGRPRTSAVSWSGGRTPPVRAASWPISTP